MVGGAGPGARAGLRLVSAVGAVTCPGCGAEWRVRRDGPITHRLRWHPCRCAPSRNGGHHVRTCEACGVEQHDPPCLIPDVDWSGVARQGLPR